MRENPDFEVLNGQVAVVTGAGRGIGASIARALATAGADLVLAGRSADSLAAVAKEIRSMGRQALEVPTDISSPTDVERLRHSTIDEFGFVDILVNNAGVIVEAPFLEITDEDWDLVLNTNLRGTFLVTRAIGRHLTERGAGKVINIASNWAYKGVPRYASYSASKAAMIALTRTLAVEWASKNVQVNAIAPGYIETDINEGARIDEKLYERIMGQIPARRMAPPDELARLVVLLADPTVRFITGETIVVDGGQLAK